MTGLWWRSKDGRRWEKQWRFMSGLDIAELRRMRSVVWLRYDEGGYAEDPLGFCPRSFSASVGEAWLSHWARGLDRIILSYALYLRLQCAHGTWDDGPPGPGSQVWTLPNVYTESGYPRHDRLR